jgi:hypothetical protein
MGLGRPSKSTKKIVLAAGVKQQRKGTSLAGVTGATQGPET